MPRRYGACDCLALGAPRVLVIGLHRVPLRLPGADATILPIAREQRQADAHLQHHHVRQARRAPTIAGSHAPVRMLRSEEHTSELQSLMRISYAVFCLKKTTITNHPHQHTYSKYTPTTTRQTQ